MLPTDLLSNPLLARSVESALTECLSSGSVVLDGSSVAEVFERSLHHAARDLGSHPRADLFRRFIRCGPLPHDAEQDAPGDGSLLGDDECGSLMEFIHAHMVNRFKGEAAELLACAPVNALLQQLKHLGAVPPGTTLYWGDTVRQAALPSLPARGRQALRKGADGVLAEATPAAVTVHGLVEVKSMRLSLHRIEAQITQHIARLEGGLTLGARHVAPELVQVVPPQRLVRVAVAPSNWRLSRLWRSVPTAENRAVEPAPWAEPPKPNVMLQQPSGTWRVELEWSVEALEEAAYDMTFWYLGEVGREVFGSEGVPAVWAGMTPFEAGQNALKAMLYALLLRPLRDRHRRIATKLYNVYCFSYPLGIDARAMLWPEDFPHDRPGEWRSAPR